LRWATNDDCDAIGDLVEQVMPHPGRPGGQKAWVLDLLRGDHPRVGAEDFTVVEDPATGQLVSCMACIWQAWSYGGASLPMGLPEVVVTRPEFRRRGLVRAQLEWIHRRAEERGALFLAIDGILNFYRQFGYEPAIQLKGYRIGYRATLPKLREEDRGRYTIRPAVERDVPFLDSVYRHSIQRGMVGCERDQEIWRYDVTRRSPGSSVRLEILVIEDRAQPIGMVAHEPHLDEAQLRIFLYELKPGVSWLPVSRAVLHHLWQTGERYAQQAGLPELSACEYYLGERHPLFDIYSSELPGWFPSIAWYVRVPDLARLVQAIAPVLEQRLAGSVLAGHSGELRVGFYHSGLYLRFDEGRIAEVSPWAPTEEPPANALFPDRTFVQLLFGHRSVTELRHAHADCWTWEKSDVLLDILFPKTPSNVLAIV
jgi:GNAT superfamily N-acetyltransferase